MYHAAGKSFSRKGQAYVKKLMRANRKKLQKKYGRKVELHHMRDRNLYVLDCYASLAAEAGRMDDPDLTYKFLNRFELARTMMPSSPLKKLRYKMRYHKISRRFPISGAQRI